MSFPAHDQDRSGRGSFGVGFARMLRRQSSGTFRRPSLVVRPASAGGTPTLHSGASTMLSVSSRCRSPQHIHEFRENLLCFGNLSQSGRISAPFSAKRLRPTNGARRVHTALAARHGSAKREAASCAARGLADFDQADEWLRQMIEQGFRSPVQDLRELMDQLAKSSDQAL
jgi:hypothetical protein